MVKKKKKYLILVLVVINLLSFNKLLGEGLGLVGRCRARRDTENKVKIYTDCQGFTRKLIGDILQARAFTLDHVILTNYEKLSAHTYEHELAHTRQYSFFGPFFLPLYGVAHIASLIDAQLNDYQNPQAINIFEIWANKMAKLPLSPKIPK